MMYTAVRALMLTMGILGMQAAGASENYPNRPVTIVVPFPAGGSVDNLTRVIAQRLTEKWGQPVVIENKTGASSLIGADFVSRAKPDGYTLAQIPLPVFRMPYTTKISWDPVDDLTYVIGLAGYSFGLVVPADSPIKDMKGYLDYAKAHPGQLTYGTPGTMTTLHLTMETLAMNAGVELSHIPYKGNSESLQAVVGKHVMSVADTPGWAPFVADGKLRLLSTWGKERSTQYPDVPTLEELGLGIVQTSPFGLAVPKGTDPVIVKKLHDAFKQAMDMPNYRDALAKFDMQPFYMGSEEYSRWAAETFKTEKIIIEKLGLNQVK